MVKDTQHSRIIDYLKYHRSITALEAINKLGITKLSTRISELKRNGYIFDQQMIETKNRYGETVRVMQYELVGQLVNGEFTPRERLEAA